MSSQHQPAAAPAESAPTPLGQKARRRLGVTLALVGGGVVALIVAGTAGFGTWAWQSDAGTGWVLGQVPGLTTEGLQGSLGGHRLSAAKITYRSGGNTLVLAQVNIKDLAWRWRPHAGAWLGLAASEVTAGTASWNSAPPSGDAQPLAPPADLRLPLALQIAAVQVGTLQVDSAPPLSAVQLTGLALGADNGKLHQVKQLQLRTDKLALQGSLQIATDAPLTLKAEWQARGLDPALPWQASVNAAGPLAELRSSARLTGSAQPGRAAPALDATATLKPFAAWPLGGLQLTTRELDLAAFATGLPQTRLSGSVDVASSGLASEARAKIALENAAAGRWDQGKAPVRKLSAQVSGTPEQLDRIKLSALLIELGNAETSAGRVRGDADLQLATGQARVSLALEQLRPAALDHRAAAMTLSGPLTLQLRGLPTQGDAASTGDATAAASGAGSAPTATASGAAPPPTRAAASLASLQVELKTQLRGRLEQGAQSGPEVTLNLDTLLSQSRIELRELLAQAAGASARLKGSVARADNRWRWQLSGGLKDFDPLPWWPGAPEGAWRKGPHRFNATLESEASAPQAALLDPLAGWAQFLGRLDLQIAPSQLAGVPLQGEVRLNGDTTGASANGRLDLAGNVVTLEGRPDRRDSGAADSWRANIKAPTLAALAPLVGLASAETQRAWAPRAGSLQGELQADGRGAGLRWRGQLLATGINTPTLQLQRAELNTQGAASLDAPLSLALKAQGLVSGEQRADLVSLDLSGSVRQHRLSLLAESPIRPPAWFEQVLGARTGSGSRLLLSAEGGWTPATPVSKAAAGQAGLLPGDWQGRIVEFQGRARDGSGQPWLAARDLRLALSLDSGGSLKSARAEPSRIELPGTALRWSAASYQAGVAGGGLPQLALQASIEPFAVAPLLDRAQPELGWRGDLMLGGEIKILRGAKFDADIVIERRSGDLSVAEDVRNSTTSQVQALGLSDLRFGLAAHDGVWHFTQGLAGKQLGELSGVASVRTRPDLAYPPADAPLDGVLQVNVARLDAWGAWVPPGWRVGGELQTKATLGGRFGAPEVTGRLSGKNLLVRNALEGVQLSDGVIELSLQGLKAQVERFEFKGGDGRLQLTGDATLGESPRVQLQVAAEQFLLLGRVDRRVVASGQATLEMNKETLKVDGQFKVDEGLIDFSRGGAPGLDDDVSVVNASGTAAAEVNPAPAGPAPAPPKGTPVRTNAVSLRVNLGEKLRIKGRGIDTALRGDLRISTPGGRLAVNGAVRTERGTYAAYSQKLVIERGELNFTGPVEDPRLDILAVRPNLDVVVGVAVTGTALNPRIRLASEPEMSDSDKLSWLVLGRAPDGLGQADTALLQRAAMALLAGENGGGSDKFLSTIGLTDFSLRQTGEGEVRETVVTLGKQLSQRWYVGYERSVNATTGTWQLIYRAAQRFTVRAQSGDDSAVDVVWTWRWN